jgi:ubiquinone/menaquinone biosynthesis C-methylase UbiE
VLLQGDAEHLPFAAARFDTMVCTLGLSSIPDDRAAVVEMRRVLGTGTDYFCWVTSPVPIG